MLVIAIEVEDTLDEVLEEDIGCPGEEKVNQAKLSWEREGEGGRERGREGERERGREGERERGRERGREGERDGGREGGRERGREGERGKETGQIV